MENFNQLIFRFRSPDEYAATFKRFVYDQCEEKLVKKGESGKRLLTRINRFETSLELVRIKLERTHNP
jgi:hypothetical protein